MLFRIKIEIESRLCYIDIIAYIIWVGKGNEQPNIGGNERTSIGGNELYLV